MKKLLTAGLTASLLVAPLTIATVPAPAAYAASVSYQSAVKQGENLWVKTKEYQRAIESGEIDGISKLYDGMTKQLSNFQKTVGQVSGASNRAKLEAKYVVPAKVEIERTIYEVSQIRLIYAIWNGLEWEENYPYDEQMAKLERLKERAASIKAAGGYKPLSAKTTLELRENEAYVSGYNLIIYDLGVEGFIDSDTDLYSADALYDDLTYYLKQTEAKIGKVPSVTGRSTLLEKFVQPAKVTVERTKYEISQLRLLDSVQDLIDLGRTEEAKTQFAKLEGLKKRGAAIKEAGGYKALPKAITAELADYEADVAAQLK